MFAYLEKNMGKVLRRDPSALEYLIPRNAAIKARVVTKDERESGLREILNFRPHFRPRSRKHDKISLLPAR